MNKSKHEQVEIMSLILYLRGIISSPYALSFLHLCGWDYVPWDKKHVWAHSVQYVKRRTNLANGKMPPSTWIWYSFMETKWLKANWICLGQIRFLFLHPWIWFVIFVIHFDCLNFLVFVLYTVRPNILVPLFSKK